MRGSKSTYRQLAPAGICQPPRGQPLTCVRMRLAAVVFADPEKYAGKVIPVAREAISWPQVADILTEVTGTKVRRALLAAEGLFSTSGAVRLIDAWDEG